MRFNSFAGSPWTRRLCAAVCVASLGILSLLAEGASAGTLAPAQTGLSSALAPARAEVSATLEECLTAEVQEERSATFAGEMNAIAGTAKMEMRIDVLERMPNEMGYHTVTAPGLGVWRSSAPGVKVYRYLKQVTNLAAPAFYRAAVRFRWLGPRGRVLSATELHSRRCEEPAPVLPVGSITPTTPGGTTPPGTGPAS
ncbi:MAG: hypothetical protein ACYDHN_06415 [Solirubrobacteraceae bacterium]